MLMTVHVSPPFPLLSSLFIETPSSPQTVLVCVCVFFNSPHGVLREEMPLGPNDRDPG